MCFVCFASVWLGCFELLSLGVVLAWFGLRLTIVSVWFVFVWFALVFLGLFLFGMFLLGNVCFVWFDQDL